MSSSSSNKTSAAERDEVVALPEIQLKVPMMKILRKSSDYEELLMSILKPDTMSGTSQKCLS